MVFSLVSVNLVGAAVAGVAAFIVGMLWYSPMLFGKKWMELSGMKISENYKDMGKMAPTMVAALVVSIISAYILGQFIKLIGAATPVEGAIVGIAAWFGFVATVSLNMVFWERKPIGLYLLNNGHLALNFAIMGAILVAMG